MISIKCLYYSLGMQYQYFLQLIENFKYAENAKNTLMYLINNSNDDEIKIIISIINKHFPQYNNLLQTVLIFS